MHTGTKWVDAVNAAYHCAEQSAQRGCLDETGEEIGPHALSVALSQLYPIANVRQLVSKYIGGLPYLTTLQLTWRIQNLGFSFCYLNLLPSPIKNLTRNVFRWAKQKIRVPSRNLVPSPADWRGLAERIHRKPVSSK